eukprot:5106898-Pyramimonas_sp.AAC.2
MQRCRCNAADATQQMQHSKCITMRVHLKSRTSNTAMQTCIHRRNMNAVARTEMRLYVTPCKRTVGQLGAVTQST